MSLSTAEIENQLTKILEDLERRGGEGEDSYSYAAYQWFTTKREKELKFAQYFVEAEGSADARKAEATIKLEDFGVKEEAVFEARKIVIRSLEERASILQSLLKAAR